MCASLYLFKINLMHINTIDKGQKKNIYVCNNIWFIKSFKYFEISCILHFAEMKKEAIIQSKCI